MSQAMILPGWKHEAERRRCQRRKLDLTLAVVSGRMGVSVSTLHHYERANRKPDKDMLTKWSAALYREAP